MRVLLTNNTLDAYAGSEMYVYDLAVALSRRGHDPIAYSRDLGPVAEDLRIASVPVIDDLGMLTARPDVIHGHHHVETMAAILRFPGVPAVYVCHGWVPWEETPVWHPRIRRAIAISKLLAERCVSSGIPAERVELLTNAVDLGRFPARPILPAAPARALVFSNTATEESYVPLLRSVCGELAIALDVLGSSAGTSTAKPGDRLGHYDLVFASGRSALEAVAVGCAVVVCDERALGGMVTSKELEHIKACNFGYRLLQNPLTADTLRREIRRYDPADARAASETIRSTADLDRLVDRFEAIYQEVIEDAVSEPTDPQEEHRAEAAYLQWLKPVITDREKVAWRRLQLEEESARLKSALHTVTAERNALAEKERALRTEYDVVTGELDATRATLTWRVRNRLVAGPGALQRPARAVARFAAMVTGERS